MWKIKGQTHGFVFSELSITGRCAFQPEEMTKVMTQVNLENACGVQGEEEA